MLRAAASRVGALFGSLFRKKDPRAEVQAALDALHGVKASDRALPEVVSAVKATPSELYASKTGPELRKLANYVYHGIGTEKNVSFASGLWVLGAMKGDLESTYSVAQCLLQGVGLAEELYGGPNEKAAEEVFEGILKQVPHGWSMFSLGTILMKRHRNGTATEDKRQLRRALELFQDAARQGVAPACLNVSNMYSYGIGINKDEGKALQWLQKAARSGDPLAQMQLASKLSKGEGIGKDEKKSFQLFEMVAQTGRPSSLFNVGVAYLMGQGVPQDDQQAIRYFKEASDVGFLPAKVNLAMMYEQGRGVPQDFERALALLQEVADAGYEEDVVDSMRAIRFRMDQNAGALPTPVDIPSGGEKPAGIQFDAKVSDDPAVASLADTLEIHVEAGQNPEAVKSLLEEASKLPNLRRDQVVEWIKARAAKDGLKIRAIGLERADRDADSSGRV
jgi:TPR repeat protein